MNKINTWMFREKNEFLFLLFSISLVVIIGYIAASLNWYIAISAIIVGFIYIKLQQAQLIGNALEITHKQFPDIYEYFEEYKRNLDLDKVKLYRVLPS